MAEFSLVEPFDIDDDSLEGIDIKTVFALGVEWANFRDLLGKDLEYVKSLAHNENVARIRKMCERHGRRCIVEDVGYGWSEITIGEKVS